MDISNGRDLNQDGKKEEEGEEYIKKRTKKMEIQKVGLKKDFG